MVKRLRCICPEKDNESVPCFAKPYRRRSRLHVDGLENANWLLYRLSELFVFKTSEPLSYIPASSEYKFCVAHSSQISGPSFEKLLAGIAEVKLMLEPAQRVATDK